MTRAEKMVLIDAFKEGHIPPEEVQALFGTTELDYLGYRDGCLGLRSYQLGGYRIFLEKNEGKLDAEIVELIEQYIAAQELSEKL